MGMIKDRAQTVLRDFSTLGVRASGPHEPTKSDLRGLFELVETAIGNSTLGGLLSARFATLAAANAGSGSLNYPAGALALVYADPTEANNDLAVKSGTSGSGSWTPTTIIRDIVEGLTAPALVEAAKAEGYFNDILDIVADNGVGYFVLGGDPLLAEAQAVLVNEQRQIVAVLNGAAPSEAVSIDPVLGDLISLGSFRGNWPSVPTSWSVGDIVFHQGRYWFCWAAVTSADAPEADPSHWEWLPVVDHDDVVFSDQFLDSGVLVGRTTKQGLPWVFTGAAAVSGQGTIGGGYLTCAGNGYYVANDLPGVITSIAIKSLGKETISISPTANLAASFAEMWHINWSNTVVGETLYWSGGVAAAEPTYRYGWSAGLTVNYAAPTTKRVEIRGRFVVGYLDDELAFVHLATLIGTLCGGGAAKSFYIQNHEASAGAQRKYAVVVKAA